MADEVNPAAATPVIGDAGSNASQGSEADSRSLTLQKAPAEEMTLADPLAQVLAMEEAYEAEQKAKKESPVGDAEAKEVEPTKAPTTEELTDVKSDDSDPDGEAEVEKTLEENPDLKDVPVRKSRLTKLIAKAHERDQLMERLAKLQLDGKKEVEPTKEVSKKEAREEVGFDGQISLLQKKIEEARVKLKTANAEYDTEQAESIREDISDAKAKIAGLEVRKELADKDQNRQSGEWASDIAKAEVVFKKQRDQLWEEDVKRVAALNDPDWDLSDEDSPAFKALGQLVESWKGSKNPIVLRGTVFRRALEFIADASGIDLPPVEAGVSASVPSVKSNVSTVQSKNSRVITGTSAARTTSTAQEQLQKLESLPFDERMRVISDIEEARELAARR